MRKENFLPPPEENLPEKEDGPYQLLGGTNDREMIMVKDLAKKCKLPFKEAKYRGEPVAGDNAYDADPVTVRNNHTLVLIECRPRRVRGFVGKLRIVDHHPEHYPEGALISQLPPENYWEACSIGQVFRLTKRLHGMTKPPKAYLIAGARDHCRFAAARGECPGVTPQEVSLVGRRWIVEEINEKKQPGETKLTRSEFDGMIARMLHTIDRSPVITVGNQEVVDLRRINVPQVYSAEFFSVYEALADLSCGAIIRTGNRADENNKVVLVGDLVASTINHFKKMWAPAHGLTAIYGCDIRGYAGGYIPLVATKAA